MSDTLRAMHFDDYLKALHNMAAPESEVKAAINVYERLRTAVVISRTVMGPEVQSEFVAAVFDQVCTESRALAAKGFELPDEM